MWFQFDESWVLDRSVSKNGTLVTLTWHISKESDMFPLNVDMESEVKKQFFSAGSNVNEVVVEIHQVKNSWQLLKEVGFLSSSTTVGPQEQVRQRIRDALSSIGYYDVQVAIESTAAITIQYPRNVSTVSNSDIARFAETISRHFPTSLVYQLSDRVAPASTGSSGGWYELSNWEFNSDASYKAAVVIGREGSVSVRLSGLCLSAIPPTQSLGGAPNITIAGLAMTQIGYQEICSSGSSSSGKLSLHFQRRPVGNGSAMIDEEEEEYKKESEQRSAAQENEQLS